MARLEIEMKIRKSCCDIRDISHRSLYQCVVLVMVNQHPSTIGSLYAFRPQAQAQAQKVSAAAASRRSINQKCKVALRVSPAVYLDDEG